MNISSLPLRSVRRSVHPSLVLDLFGSSASFLSSFSLIYLIYLLLYIHLCVLVSRYSSSPHPPSLFFLSIYLHLFLVSLFLGLTLTFFSILFSLFPTFHSSPSFLTPSLWNILPFSYILPVRQVSCA